MCHDVDSFWDIAPLSWSCWRQAGNYTALYHKRLYPHIRRREDLKSHIFCHDLVAVCEGI
jgi:hypothetical protein